MGETDRHLDWPGCFNVRDLGGLSGAGGVVSPGAFIRADALADLTADGWASLWAHGVRTVVDLRNDDEITGDRVPRPPGLRTVHVPLDGSHDREFWNVWEAGPQFGTPLYYRPHLERFPDRSAAVLSAIARAEPGGVAFHCTAGRDRSGQIALLLLTLLGVAAHEIAADYDLSAERLAAKYHARGEEDHAPMLATYLAGQGTTARQVVTELVERGDLPAVLRRGGLTADDVRRLLARGLAD